MLSPKKGSEGTECFSQDIGFPLISKIESIEHIYSKLSDPTAYSQSKQAVTSASDCIETVYCSVRIFMQLIQKFCMAL